MPRAVDRNALDDREAWLRSTNLSQPRLGKVMRSHTVNTSCPAFASAVIDIDVLYVGYLCDNPNASGQLDRMAGMPICRAAPPNASPLSGSCVPVRAWNVVLQVAQRKCCQQEFDIAQTFDQEPPLVWCQFLKVLRQCLKFVGSHRCSYLTDSWEFNVGHYLTVT